MPVIYRPSIKQLKDKLETQTKEIVIDRLRRDLLAGEQFDKPVLTPHHYRSGDEFVPTRKLKNSTGSVSPDGIAPDFDALFADIPDKFATSEHPKLKFLFTVQFFPRNSNTETFKETGSDSMETMAFALKRATRPTPSVVYQDINFYNYRTKIATKIDYGTMTVSFYDDSSNRAHELFVKYLNMISPISTTGLEDADNLFTTDITTKLAMGSGIGSLPDRNGPFQAIRITHHTLNPDRYKTENIYNLPADDESSYSMKIHYDFINPKIINFNMDELDMSQSDVNIVELSLVYDTVNIWYENPIQFNGAGSASGSGSGLGFKPTVTVLPGNVDSASGPLGNLKDNLSTMVYKPKKS